MVKYDFIILIYTIKRIYIMGRRKIEKKKIVVSISVDPDILDIINDTISNRSKFIQNIMIEEMCKNLEIKEELQKLRIIL